MRRGSIARFPRRIQRLSAVVVVSHVSLRIAWCGVHNTNHIGATRRPRALVNDACPIIGHSPRPVEWERLYHLMGQQSLWATRFPLWLIGIEWNHLREGS